MNDSWRQFCSTAVVQQLTYIIKSWYACLYMPDGCFGRVGACL